MLILASQNSLPVGFQVRVANRENCMQYGRRKSRSDWSPAWECGVPGTVKPCRHLLTPCPGSDGGMCSPVAKGTSLFHRLPVSLKLEVKKIRFVSLHGLRVVPLCVICP